MGQLRHATKRALTYASQKRCGKLARRKEKEELQMRVCVCVCG